MSLRATSPALLLVLPLLSISVVAGVDAETLVVGPPATEGDRRAEYPLELLRLALGEDFELEQSPDYPPERARSVLREGDGLQIWATATRADWEEELLAVRVPILQGLLGARVLLIRGDDQPRFSRIESSEELRKLVAGVGRDWSITSILRDAGFEIRESADYEGLFAQLAAGRFDYFPRGATEAPVELDLHSATFPGLALETDLLLMVPLPMYYFVTPRRADLAALLRARLEERVEDGSLRRLFLQRHGALLERLALEGRRVLRIENPELPPETPIDRSELWMVPLTRAAPVEHEDP